MNPAKRIILATDAWQPQVNGVVKCVEEMKRHLQENNFEVTVIHPGLFYSLPLFFYPEIRFSFFPNRKIKKIVKEKNPDYVHIVTEGPIGFSIRKVCLKASLKFTTANHTNFQQYIKYYLGIDIGFFSTVICAYLKWFHNASNGTMVITRGLKEALEKRGFLHVLFWPLGVDTELFQRNQHSSVPQTHHFTTPVFVYFGRIAKEKNVEEYLTLDLPGTKLVIGDGPLKKGLEKKYGKSAVFVGYKRGKELVDFLSMCDVFVFPSMTDTFPLAIIEAFACGLPVAAHNVMDLKNIVKEGVGFLDEDLARAAMACLHLSGEQCRAYALEFSWKKSAEYFIKNLVKSESH